MSDDRDNPLLLAVEHLTKTQRSKVIQGETVHTVELPPLLVQLDEAIRSSMGGASTSGASLAFEGAPLNTSALFEAMKISTQIKDWCRLVKVTPVKDSRQDLTAWYMAASRNTVDLDHERHYVKTLTGWANKITSILNPPRERDLPEPCPICGADAWYDPKDGKRYLRPLIIRYRPTDDDMLNTAKATCRACAEVWNVRELAYAIEQKAEERA